MTENKSLDAGLAQQSDNGVSGNNSFRGAATLAILALAHGRPRGACTFPAPSFLSRFFLFFFTLFLFFFPSTRPPAARFLSLCVARTTVVYVHSWRRRPCVRSIRDGNTIVCCGDVYFDFLFLTIYYDGRPV